jgi:hypothetical protein
MFKTQFRCFYFILFFISISLSTQAMVTELGLSYGFQKRTFDANNKYQLESKSASIALYMTEHLALDISYTDGFIEQKTKDVSERITQQTSRIYGADLMVLLAKRTDLLQPYVKGGIAQIEKKQKIKVADQSVYETQTPSSTVPSYGAGIKIRISETFSLKFGVDYWRTPLDDGSKTEDSAFKAGVSWVL